MIREPRHEGVILGDRPISSDLFLACRKVRRDGRNPVKDLAGVVFPRIEVQERQTRRAEQI